MWDVFLAAWPVMVSVLHVAGAVAVTLHAVLGRREVPAIIGWVGLAWLAPVIGSFAYVAFGINRIKRKAVRLGHPAPVLRPTSITEELAARVLDEADERSVASLLSRPGMRGLTRLGESVTGNPLLPGNRITALVDGDQAFPEMLAAINSAVDSVWLLSYIFDADRVGLQFLEALRAAHARGVQVRVLIDDVGARYSRPSMPSRIADAGIPVRTFLPTRGPRVLRYANLRNHRKILVVDGTVGFTGGMNIREGHQLSLRPESPVRCLHFKCEGPIVDDMAQVFATDWAFSCGETLTIPARKSSPDKHGSVIARGVPDGPDSDIDNLPEMLIGALASARERVRIVTPYFLPDGRLLSALRVAAMRGITVDIVLPAQNNITIMNWAVVPQFTELLEVGCAVWLSPPPFDHTKLFVVDGHWSLIGSTNWDARSLRLNFEYNIECFDHGLAATLESLAESRIVSAHRVDMAALHARPFWQHLRDGLARLLSPYL
ncbi:MAG: phospholipase [Gemmatimonadaceae bacterium]|nr:phospholipase [Gemmatimonadaceae bacterium]